MNGNKKAIFFIALFMLFTGWCYPFWNLPWFEFTAQPGHRISVLIQASMLVGIFIWISFQTIKLKKRYRIFVIGGLICVSGIGYLAKFGGPLKEALVNDNYPIFRDSLFYQNDNYELIVLQKLNPTKNVTHVRRHQIFTELPLGVRISKSRSIQDMDGEWTQCSKDFTDCRTVWFADGHLYYRKPD